MNTFHKLALLFTVSMLTACTTTAPPVLVQQKVFVPPPDNLMIDCSIAPPPDRTLWSNAVSERDRTNMASTAYNTQVTNTQLCNNRMAQLRTWVQQNVQVYSAKPAASTP